MRCISFLIIGMPLVFIGGSALKRNPYLKLLRSQLEQYILDELGEDWLSGRRKAKELRRIKREIDSLTRRLKELEKQRAELEQQSTTEDRTNYWSGTWFCWRFTEPTHHSVGQE